VGVGEAVSGDWMRDGDGDEDEDESDVNVIRMMECTNLYVKSVSAPGLNW